MFQVGDKVKRIREAWNDMEIGDTATVLEVTGRGLILKEFPGPAHDPKMFELVESETIVGDAGLGVSGFQQISYQYPFKGFGVGGLVTTLQDEIVNKVNSNNKKPMSLLNTLRKITMTEPDRSNMKAGIIDEDKNLTAEGRDVVMHILYEDYAERIKKEVSDKILKEQEKK